MKSDQLLQLEPQNYENRDDISLSTLNVLFWMVDDSGLPRLQAKGQGILLSLFDSMEEAREYRTEIESRQFRLSSLFRHGETNKVAELM